MKRSRRVGANAAWRRSDYRFAVASLALLIFLLGTSVVGWLLRNQHMAIASPRLPRRKQPRGCNHVTEERLAERILCPRFHSARRNAFVCRDAV
jgi:hypothetical protein